MSYQQQLSLLFNQIAPEYDASHIIEHLRHKFPMLDDQEFVNRAAECLKFLYLRSISGKGFIPLSGDVDEVWHEFILQTREYQTFCESLPGKDFIHHNSIRMAEHAEQVSKKETVRNLLEWIPSYVKHFGPFSETSAKYWMIIQVLQQEFDYSLDQINQLA